MRIGLAFRAFFKILFNAEAAAAVEAALSGVQPETRRIGEPEPAEPRRPPPPPPPAPLRSEAITLLATLQREARFVDIVSEPLAEYSDAQIGAAARDVLRDCQSVLERLFALRPVEDQQEGAPVEIPAGFDAGRYRLTGNVQGEPPFRGSLVHHGWEATKCDLPQWAGSNAASRIIAPAEVELK